MLNNIENNNCNDRFTTTDGYDAPLKKEINNFLQRANSGTRNHSDDSISKSTMNVTKQEFIDELFLALRLFFVATICVHDNDEIDIRFTDDCHFNIKVTGEHDE